MNKKTMKLFLFIGLFVLGVVLGNVKNNGSNKVVENNNEKMSIDEVDDNFFMRCGNLGEKAIDNSFGVLIKGIGETIKFIFGV